MKLIARFICVLICFLCVLSLCSCGVIFSYLSELKEDKAYQNAIDKLFDALDDKDEDAVYSLFSPYARESDENIRADIQKMLSVYKGTTDDIGWDGLLGGDYHDGYDGQIKEVYAIFPVRSGDTYYWFDLRLTYVNTIDESKVGITQLDLYTADEYFIFLNDDDAFYTESYGIEVYADKTVEKDIRCVDGKPYVFNSFNEKINLSEVKSFLEKSNSTDEFKNRFGQPHAYDIYCIYELPSENGKARYIKVGDDDNGKIYGVSIVDDFGFIESIYFEEE